MLPRSIYALFLIIQASSAANVQRDWPTERHDTRNTAYTSQEVQLPLKEVWRVPTVTGPKPMLLASGEVICVVQNSYNNEQPTTLLIDRAGKTRWRLSNTDPLYLKGDTLIVMEKSGSHFALKCLNWRNRKTLWSYSFLNLLNYNSPHVMTQTNRLYLSVMEGTSEAEIQRLMCFDLKTGTLIALFSLNESMAGGDFAIDGSRLYWKLGHVGYVMDAQTLDVLKQFNNGGHLYPMVIGDRILGQQGMGVFAIDRNTRKNIWIQSAYSMTAHALVQGKRKEWLVVESLPPNGTLAGIEVRTGKIRWRYSLMVGGQYGYNAAHNGGLSAGSGKIVYVPGWREHPSEGGKMRGGFYGLEGATGKLLWQQERVGIKGISVIVSEGSVYALDNKGFLSRFDRK